jgi:hypothetical protein
MYYATYSGTSLPTFRDNLPVQAAKVNEFVDFLTPEDGTDKLSRNVGNELPLYAA